MIAEAKEHLGRYYAALAGTLPVTSGVRKTQFSTARDYYQQALTEFTGAQEQKMLNAVYQ